MSDTEYATFSASLDSDPVLKQQVEDVETLLSGIESAALKEKLEGYHKDILSDQSEEKVVPIASKKKKNYAFIAIAASLVATIGLFWFFTQKTGSEKLFAEYFVPDPGLPTNMSEMENFDFYDAMVDYKQGNYADAIDKWENQLKFKTESDTLHYFIGVAQLAKGDETEAIEHLKSVVDLSNSIFTKDAHYYLGLAYLKGENITEAKRNLTESENANVQDILSELTNQ